MNNSIVKIAREYAIACHEAVNHRYGNKPYSSHLKMVFVFGIKYIHLIPEEFREQVLASLWTHDLIEDARQTYNDVKKVCGEFVAEITYALTNEKGRTRSDRANQKYYDGILITPYADFAKICDRLANVSNSRNEGHGMVNTYKKEQPHFEATLRVNETYAPMWNELNSLLD